ncbi:LytR/AlgR family response regulator transcription factor [Bifidobacterium miconisargentati]|uniref:LytR/AlgR family response regulator transcription factor n=1 Tax=Bifidobacterium miconisargentati TaxID=2834437 RepID=UPI001BDD8818|nr:LytTR family DNA-binding domain-containing protein [Bifidobacterium miconisargentati]MBW3090095.1 response regulator transcription factor [Bifidobacterium miconisargentati]
MVNEDNGIGDSSATLRVCVVDDEQSIRDAMEEHLERYRSEHGIGIKIDMYSDGESLLREYRSDCDLILLDVEMGSVDGFETARMIRNIDNGVSIVFVTNMSQMAIRGYEVNALSYLVKPVPYFALERELDRCLNIKEHRIRDTSVMVSVPGGLARVSVGDILYLESGKRHRILLHTLQSTYEFNGSLRGFQDQLPENDFYSCNSCYLVNMRHVVSVKDSECVVYGGDVLEISRRRRRGFLQSLGNRIS